MIVGNKCSLYERKRQNKTKYEFVEYVYEDVQSLPPVSEIFQENNTEDFNKRMKELASMLPPRKYNSKN